MVSDSSVGGEGISTVGTGQWLLPPSLVTTQMSQDAPFRAKHFAVTYPQFPLLGSQVPKAGDNLTSSVAEEAKSPGGKSGGRIIGVSSHTSLESKSRVLASN